MLDIVASNRTRHRFFVGLNTGYVTDGEPDARCVEFYKRRSSPALFCVIVGNVVIPGGHGTNASTPTISRSRMWATIARTIENHGSCPGVQLTTTWEGYKGSRSFRPSDASQAIDSSRKVVRELGSAGVASVLASLKNGAEIAIEAGFRHVQVHAAHGYLLSLLVDGRIYDGAREIRSWLIEWSLRMRANRIATSIRISLRTGDKIFDALGRDEFHNSIASMPFDFIDVSSGFYNIDKQLIYPARPDTLRERRQETLLLAERHRKANFILSGRALIQSDEDLPSNVHIGLCRDLIANPDYLNDRNRRCVNSGKCHYFSRGGSQLTCTQWQPDRERILEN
jgi:2,4-dienoyl-CoA reductase-like NADH-dependent reductase (Old Yellow Enzyme family)